MANQKQTLLLAEQIKIGIASVTESQVCLFLKADPRIIMDMMDKKFGPLGWKKNTEIVEVGGTKVCKCTISVKDDGEWITRTDYSGDAEWAGANEPKVMDSDAFRRCAMDFDVGRELYSFDNIIVPVLDTKGNVVLNIQSFEKANALNGTIEKVLYCADEFYIEQLKYSEEGKIVALSIKTTSGKRVFCESREGTVLQSTITPDGNDADLDKARQIKVEVGALKGKTLGELEPGDLLAVWSTVKGFKKLCCVVARANPEARALFIANDIKL